MVAGRLFVKCTGVTSSYNSIYTSFVVTRYRLIASWRVLASFILNGKTCFHKVSTFYLSRTSLLGFAMCEQTHFRRIENLQNLSGWVRMDHIKFFLLQFDTANKTDKITVLPSHSHGA